MCNEKGFSTTAIERCNRIKSFVFPRRAEMVADSELVKRLRALYAVRDEFVRISSKFEAELSLVEGFLTKMYNDWSSYEAIMEGIDEMKDAIDEKWFFGNCVGNKQI